MEIVCWDYKSPFWSGRMSGIPWQITSLTELKLMKIVYYF